MACELVYTFAYFNCGFTEEVGFNSIDFTTLSVQLPVANLHFSLAKYYDGPCIPSASKTKNSFSAQVDLSDISCQFSPISSDSSLTQCKQTGKQRTARPSSLSLTLSPSISKGQKQRIKLPSKPLSRTQNHQRMQTSSVSISRNVLCDEMMQK